MKNIKFIAVALLVIGSCSPKIYDQSILDGKIYESKRGPLYRENRIFFNSDSTFVYIRQGPSIFFSMGSWQYNPSKREISFKSTNPEGKFMNPTTVDTLWVDISNNKAKFISKKKIIFEDIVYYQE